MSRAPVLVRASSSAPRLAQTAALIAEDGAHAELADILASQGYLPIEFDCIETLLESDWSDDRAQPAEPSVLVWATSDISGAPGVIKRLVQHLGDAPVVLVCAGAERWDVRAALAAGASGMVLRDDLNTALAPCLQAVGAGQICIPREHGSQIAPDVLSAREKQILGLVVMGYMNSQIADRLFLAESTVKSHLSSAFRKLGVRSRNEAADLILNPSRGLGMGILALGGEPLKPTSRTAA